MTAVNTLQTIERWSDRAETLSIGARAISAAARLVGATRAEQFASGFCEISTLCESSLIIARRLIDARGNADSRIVYSLWEQGPLIATMRWGDGRYQWRDVLGVPVVCDQYAESYWFASPEGVPEIMARMRSCGASWRFKGKTVSADQRAVPETLSARTRDTVDRLRRFQTPRAQLLWGPPGGGKTVAARQILQQLAPLRVELCPANADRAQIWDALDELRPDGILLDDIDSVEHLDALLDRLERARSYARVIVSTANTLKLRGALLRPGRASDDAPIRFDTLDPASADAIAPSVPRGMQDGLLAAYLAELEARAGAGVLADTDAPELRQRMADAGDR